MSLAHRYERDESAPTATQARRDLFRRTLRPAAGLWGANLAVGLTIVGPLDGLPAEEVVNEELVDARTPVMNAVTHVWTNIGGTHFLIIACLLAVAVLWWRTRQWWFAVVPAIALSVQSAVFTTSSFLIGRGRPDVPHLDVSPPTSGFPSGHTGASTAFYLVMALLAQRIRHPVWRGLATALFLAIPLLVGFSRMYRGMHHLSDVVAGLINGTVCAWLAWRYLRRSDDDAGAQEREEAGPPVQGAAGLPASEVPPRPGTAVTTRRDGPGRVRSRHTPRSRAP